MYDKHYQAWVNTKKNIHPAHDYLEKPAMVSVLSKTKKKYKKILLLGCGEGSEIEVLKQFLEETVQIHGVDSSFQLIELAKYNYPEYEFFTQKLEDLNLNESGFDLVYSSLTMHYIENWTDVLSRLEKVTTEGCEFIFSIQHPIKWGGQTTRSKEKNSFLMGYTKYKNESKDYRVYGDYLNNYKINDKLFGKIEIEYYNKSISEIFKIVKNSNFELVDFLEPKPIEKSKALLPDFYEVYSKIPLFAIFHLKKI